MLQIPPTKRPIKHLVSTHLFVIPLLAVALILGSCASEDAGIVNPPPGTAHIVVRIANMVPDNLDRRLVLEQNYQTDAVPSGGYSATVTSPSDSSFVEILANGTSEYRSPSRIRFTRQSVYDIIAVGKPNGASGFDTIVVSNANTTLTALPVAQVRIINTFPDTLRTFEVRLGCPNGTALVSTPVPFRAVTLYEEVPPGNVVFSFQEHIGTATTQLGTYECTLKQRTPYTILIRQAAESASPIIQLIEESDFTSAPQRELLPILERDANMRVLNMSTSNASVTLQRTGQEVVKNQSPLTMSGNNLVPTCEQQASDVISMTLSDGRSYTDSTSLTLRGDYTIVVADKADSASMIIVPPLPVVYDAAGKSIIRVVNAAYGIGKVTVSTGARANQGAPNGLSSGMAIASNADFGSISAPVVLSEGELPIIVSTARLPTTILDIRRSSIRANTNYLLVVSQTVDGVAQTYLFEETGAAGTVTPMNESSLITFVNASPKNEQVQLTIGTVIINGTVFYRNSVSTSAFAGPVSVSAGSAQLIAKVQDGLRTLVLFTNHSDAESLIELTTPPLRQIPGVSDRRVINATGDLDAVTMTYDTLYHLYPDSSEIIARDVPFGQASPTHVLQRDRRGSMYVYDATTRKRLYTLPITLGPLGNSYSLIVVGNKESGYEVIVLQEF